MSGAVFNGIIYLAKGKDLMKVVGVSMTASKLAHMVTPIIMGTLMDNHPNLDHGYYWVTRYSSLMAVLGLATSVLIYIQDQNGDKVLSISV